jgi:hypothetical protein
MAEVRFGSSRRVSGSIAKKGCEGGTAEKNVRAMIGLYVGHFNYSRVHETLRTTPAVALGITDRVWSIGEPLDAALPR